MPDLKQDVRTYVDRLAAEAEQFATEHVTTPTPPTAHGSHWLLAAAAAAAVVVVVAVATLFLRDGNDESTIQASREEPRQVTPDRLLHDESNLEVFMRTDAERGAVAAVRRAITGSDDIRRYAYLDHNASLREFRRFTRDNPALSDDIPASELPESFRIELGDCSAKTDLRVFFDQLPGVDEVVTAAGLSHELAKRWYGSGTGGRDFPSKTLVGRCGGRLPSRSESLREARTQPTSTTTP